MMFRFDFFLAIALANSSGITASDSLKPGSICTSSVQCKSEICCGKFLTSPGYCSACCNDADCTNGDVCALRSDVYPDVKIRTCIKQNGLENGKVCSKNEACSSGFCNSVRIDNWNATFGVCSISQGNGKNYNDYYDVGFDYSGNDIRDLPMNSSRECQLECQKEPTCLFFAFGVSIKKCWLKKIATLRNVQLDRISGPKYTPGDCTLPSYIKSDGKKYCGFYLQTMLSFEESQNHCQRLGASLPEFRNLSDYNALSPLKPTILNNIWVNAKATDDQGHFEWLSDNSNVNFTSLKWGPSQPNLNGEECLLFNTIDGTFHDFDCKGNGDTRTYCEVKTV